MVSVDTLSRDTIPLMLFTKGRTFGVLTLRYARSTPGYAPLRRASTPHHAHAQISWQGPLKILSYCDKTHSLTQQLLELFHRLPEF
jgi:hypothetical protein